VKRCYSDDERRLPTYAVATQRDMRKVANPTERRLGRGGGWDGREVPVVRHTSTGRTRARRQRVAQVGSAPRAQDNLGIAAPCACRPPTLSIAASYAAHVWSSRRRMLFFPALLTNRLPGPASLLAKPSAHRARAFRAISALESDAAAAALDRLRNWRRTCSSPDRGSCDAGSAVSVAVIVAVRPPTLTVTLPSSPPHARPSRTA